MVTQIFSICCWAGMERSGNPEAVVCFTTCAVCRRIALEAIETLLLLVGMYEFFRFTLLR